MKELLLRPGRASRFLGDFLEDSLRKVVAHSMAIAGRGPMMHDSAERSQREVCARVGAKFCPSPGHMKLGIATNIREGGMPINGLRHPAEGDAVGWYIWAGEELDQDPDAWLALHVEHLEDWCPEAVRYLGLPPGWRFLWAEEQEEVWEDKSLLDI